MPRLLPRLIRKLTETPPNEPTPRHLASGGYVRLRRKLPCRPASERPSFSAIGRTQSILLDPQSPVTDSRAYLKHKLQPPRVQVSSGGTVSADAGLDTPREMSVQEREWWSSPYLRMLSSPIRRCAISRRHMPSDFLIRLAALRLRVAPGTKSAQVWMPDGLEHPKFRRRSGQLVMYITCWNDMFSPVNLNRVSSRGVPNAVFHKLLSEQISHLLRVRVIQELQLLAETLSRRPRRNNLDPTILCRLTRGEYRVLRETGVVPRTGAVAVLVVPPVNKNSKTREKVVPSMQPEIPSDEESPDCTSKNGHRRPLPPLSTIYGSEPQQGELPLSSPHLVPNAQVPLYNGLALFPSAPQRSALHKALRDVLRTERYCRVVTHPMRGKSVSSDDKASHAFLLVSDESTVTRTDSVPLAIALWRLRMWEGDAYQSEACSGGWEVDGEWRTKSVF